MTETVDWRLPMPPGFRWPDGIRAAACFTFDVDAESPILYEYPETAAWLDVMSHQAYGARTGIARILRVLDRRRVRSTFFIPGYSAERWPAICRSIRDAGHEIAHHGYLHEGAHGATPAVEEARLLRGLASLDEVLGVHPIGYRGPNWELTFETPSILARHGFVYDSGLMDADHPYVLAASAEPGGLSAHDALAIVRLLRGIAFVGFDVVEVIPAYDPAGQTAFLAANLAYEMLSLVALRRSAR